MKATSKSSDRSKIELDRLSAKSPFDKGVLPFAERPQVTFAQYRQLMAGKKVTLADGRVVGPDDGPFRTVSKRKGQSSGLDGGQEV